MRRRAALALGAAALAGCGPASAPAFDGGWVGDAAARGHRLRDDNAATAPGAQRRAGVLVCGAGIAGLAAARALLRAGIEDVHVLDLEDVPGGNSRGHRLAGIDCPLGAHYLPLPPPAAHEVAEWLHEIGLARSVAGRTVYNERHLCHSPQERLFFDGAWHDGLLPPAPPGSATLAAYRRFAQALARETRVGFALPAARAPWSAAHAALDAVPFGTWLRREGLADDTPLRWYLDYCCRDDYGAGVDTVSAWAGLHYFASRRGFRGPDEDAAADRDPVLTWPEGNAWLVQRLAAPLLDGRFHGHRTVRRVRVGRDAVEVDAWDAAQRLERWRAARVVLALPLFVAARVLDPRPAALADAAAGAVYAPWLVANLHIDSPLLDRPGAAPAWDNVVYAGAGLGYVDARHQSLRPAPAPTVLTAYRPLPPGARAALLERSWRDWAQAVLDDLRGVHPDLPAKTRRIDLARHGHAMSVPVPGRRGSAALAAFREAAFDRVHFAHADLAGYSVFEEAFTFGDAAGRAAARGLARSG